MQLFSWRRKTPALLFVKAVNCGRRGDMCSVLVTSDVCSDLKYLTTLLGFAKKYLFFQLNPPPVGQFSPAVIINLYNELRFLIDRYKTGKNHER